MKSSISDLNFVHMMGLLVGGLALFLFGLELMTGGLKAIAGSRMQTVLGTLTANRLRGVLAGAGVTALLNSSTITTVLMVGFVSTGLMTLGQAIPMIMGANIGKTFTAQLIAFDLSAITPFMLAIGFLLHAFGGRQLFRQLGGILLGFGMLFLGIEFMGDATRPLRTFQPFIDIMQDMTNPLLGIIVGAVFTAIVQSSAATLGIIIALASEGLMPLEAGIALVLGANVGTVGTALLSAIGKSAEALQVGVVHLLFNVIGVLLFIFIIPQLGDFVRAISPSYPELAGVERLAAETPRQVANTHTVFSVASTLILVWFTGPIGRLARLIVPAAPPSQVQPIGDPIYLDENSLTVPALALQRVRLELARLGEQVLETVRREAVLVVNGKVDDISALLEQDKQIERLATAILHYIGRLSQEEHSAKESRQMVDLAQVVTSLEGINDVVTTNLVSVNQQRLAEGIDLSLLHDEHTARFGQAVIDNLGRAVEIIGAPDTAKASRVVAAKAEIEGLATAAHQSVLTKLRPEDKANVINFRLASDVIEQFKQVARFSRAIAEATQDI
ncbi:MAG: Na/Pi cotransporter family protein [Phyllobacterium sp.]|uniref:Na/Pi cotransporter family protein n=1 Tax=Phyllobacterium sp. TaxID=1871046 RepID=UPI0030F1D4F7